MTRDEFAARVADCTGLSKAAARGAIDCIFSTDDGVIVSELRDGRDFPVTGFGRFGTRAQAARMGQNPQTGEKIQIPARTVPNFKAGKGLKDAVR